MVRKIFLLFALISAMGYAGTVFAFDQSSANYQNRSSTFSPMTFDSTSPNFQLNASLDSIVGGAESADFNTMQGVPLREVTPAVTPTPTPTPTPSGPSGGIPVNYPNMPTSVQALPLPIAGQRIQAPPAFTYRHFTFKTSQRLTGTRDAVNTQVWINGYSLGVSYPDPSHWERSLPLFLGSNLITAQAFGDDGVPSEIIGGQIERILIGDVNHNRYVDDADISLFSRAVSRYNFFADFNEDGKVNDLDLSLLASHWHLSY